MTRHILSLIMIGGTLLAIAAIALIPTQHHAQTTRGLDSYQYHRPLFDSHTQSQDVFIHQGIIGIGALLVNLRGSEDPADVTLTITDPDNGQLLHKVTIPGPTIVDDQFEHIIFSDPLLITNKTVRITLAARRATAQTALGIRFHPDNVYSKGQSYHNGEPQAGDLAIMMVERVPLWYRIGADIGRHPERSVDMAIALAGSILIAALSIKPGWSTALPRRQRIIEFSLLGAIAALALIPRLILLNNIGGVSGGDPYNYLFITDKISHLANPFEGVKRLPGYPLVLLPAYLTALDDHTWMRLTNIVSAAGIIFLLGVLARRLHLPWPVQLLAPTILAIQKDFLWLSLRPEAYTFYAFLLTLSLVLFTHLTTWRWQLFFGFTLGYAAMTRQEGFVLAAVLGSAAAAHLAHTWIKHQRRSSAVASPRQLLARYAIAFAPALLLVLPFFLHNTIVYGNPLYTPYFEGERLQVVDSYAAFQDSAQATWGVLSSMWRPIWDQLWRIPLNHPPVAATGLTLILWWCYHWLYLRHRFARPWIWIITAIVFLAGTIWISYTFTTSSARFSEWVAIMTASALLVCIPPFLAATRWPGLIVAAVALSQILIATWFHPFPKHYQQDYPLLVLMVATLLIPWLPNQPAWSIRSSAIVIRTAILFPFALVLLSLWQTDRLNALIDDYNSDTALDSVIYRATQYAKDLPQPIGFDQAYLPARLYFGDDTPFFGEDDANFSQLEPWAKQHRLKTVIITNDATGFADPPADWHMLKRYRAEGNNERMFESRIYTIP